MAYVIITLILTFGLALTCIGVRLIRGQRRMEHRQTVALAALRAAFGVPPQPGEHDADRSRPSLVLYRGGLGILLAAALLTREHVWRAVGIGASAAAAAVIAVSLAVDRPPGTPGAPPYEDAFPTTGLTGAITTQAPAADLSAPAAAPTPSAPTSTGSASPAPSASPAGVVLTGGAPLPSAAPTTPSSTGSAPSTPRATASIQTPTPSGTVPCLLAVYASPLPNLCVP